MASTHNTPKLRIAALLFAAGAIAGAAQPASAQTMQPCCGGTTYQTLPLGSGTMTYGSNGTSYQTIPLGNGTMMMGSDGSHCRRMPLGNGYTTTCN
jgi:hypothetical protein